MRVLFVLVSFLFSCIAQAEFKPNIIIFYVDDLGWQDTNIYNVGKSSPWQTPNMQALANDGMLFTQGYSPAPTCGPSRAGLLTGQHPAKTGFTHVNGNRLPNSSNAQKMIAPFFINSLPTGVGEIILSEALQQNGYRTAQVGKWHIHGTKKGFDMAYTKRGAHSKVEDRSKDFSSYNPKEKFPLGNELYPPMSEKHPNGIPYPYQPVTEEALNFIRDSTNDEQPFFLYLAHWMVHYPIVTRNRNLLEYYTDKLGIDFPKDKSDITTPGQTNPYYGAMVTTVDWSLGRVLDVLKTTDDPRNPGKKLIETTYIFMSSDNGGAEDRRKEIITDNAPLDMGKKYAQEGGVRVPMIISGPTIKAGTQFDGMVNQLDYFPTIMSLTGTTLTTKQQAKLSGLDISPVLNGKSNIVKNASGIEREFLWWHFPHNSDAQMQSAIREGDFKLYKNYKDNSYSLFQLYKNGQMHDIGEQKDLVAEKAYANIVNSLSNKLETLLAEHNAEFPSRNPKYKDLSEADKNVLPVIEKYTYNAKQKIASIQLATNKTPLNNAYVLVKGKKYKRYVRHNASIETKPGSKLMVTAKLPADVIEYVFVLIDNNNFMIQSDVIKAKKKDSL
ncbi:sulfatase [Shewanella sp. 10N.7]|uniref:sulfatase n=1 Tax=Shewanella sp. 10N.7 TaxID=2885093 RepID=UPI001E41ECA9|nr:sulfatase [Shewanella sp. 10N.7]MCC4831794.1 sulfatase [Shewanella sp. 10N.7]